MNNEANIWLNEVRNILLNTIDPNISLHTLRELNRNVYQLYECDLVYLHLRILFHTPNDVDQFLENYSNLHGVYATHMFVNHPLLNINIFPMDAAMQWTNDRHMLRVLYRWGANARTPDENMNMNVSPYRNYLSRYELMENIGNNNNYPALRGLRIRNEFYEVSEENSFLSGREQPPNDWQMPVRVRIPNHNNNNIIQY